MIPLRVRILAPTKALLLPSGGGENAQDRVPGGAGTSSPQQGDPGGPLWRH